jgi:hypothetical protein
LFAERWMNQFARKATQTKRPAVAPALMQSGDVKM